MERDYLSPDGKYYVRQTHEQFQMGSLNQHSVNSFGPIEIMNAEDDSVVFALDNEDATYVQWQGQDNVIGWHGEYLVLLMMPGRLGPGFSCSTAFIAVISMEKQAIVQRNRIFYKDFRLHWNDEGRVRIFCESSEEDWLKPGTTFLKKGECSATAGNNSVTVNFADCSVDIPKMIPVNAPDLEAWSDDMKTCYFYGKYQGRDMYVKVAREENRVLLDTWGLGARPEFVKFENGFHVPNVSGLEARRAHFQWDDIGIEYLDIKSKPKPKSKEEICKEHDDNNTVGLQDWQLKQLHGKGKKQRHSGSSDSSDNKSVIIALVIFITVVVATSAIAIISGHSEAGLIGGSITAAAGIFGGIWAIIRNYIPIFDRKQNIWRLFTGMAFLFTSGAYQVTRGIYWLSSLAIGNIDYGWFLLIMEVIMIGCSIVCGRYSRNVHRYDKDKGERLAWLNVFFIPMIFGVFVFVAMNNK